MKDKIIKKHIGIWLRIIEDKSRPAEKKLEVLKELLHIWLKELG